MRLVKILGYSLLALADLIILSIVAIVILVDPNDFKAEIAQVVKNHTGRELKLEGDLGLSFFPWLALEIRQAQLSNRAGFGEEPFAAIQEADVGVRLWPLLRGELEVGRVRLYGMRLNLSVDKRARSNWEDLGGKAAAETAPQAPPPGDMKASIAGLTVKNCAISYRDAQSDSRIRIENLSLETGRLSPGEPMSIDLSFGFASGKESDGTLLPIGLKIPALQIDMEKETLQAPEFTLSLQPARIRGQLSGQKILQSPAFNGRLTLEEVSLRELLKTLAIDPPKTRDAKALNALSLQAAFAATADNLQLSSLKLKLDDTQMTGQLGIADFQTQALRFDLDVDRIDLDRYLEPEADQKPKAAGPAEPLELPMELLKTLNAKGTLDIGALTMAGLKLTAVKFKVDAGNGVVRIDPSQAQLYNGTHRGKITLDARGNAARLSIDEQLQGVEFSPILQELFDSKRLTGKDHANMTLTATGNDSQTWLKTVDGNLNLSITDGALEGMDLWYEIQRARALFKREAPPTEGSSGRTVFKTLKASATVEDGTMHNRDLDVDTEHLQVAGEGKLVLASLRVDYLLNAKVIDEAKEGDGAQDVRSLEIPVRITGTVGDLKVRPDLESKVKEEAKKKIEEKKEELREKVEDQLKKLFKRRDE